MTDPEMNQLKARCQELKSRIKAMASKEFEWRKEYLELRYVLEMFEAHVDTLIRHPNK